MSEMDQYAPQEQDGTGNSKKEVFLRVLILLNEKKQYFTWAIIDVALRLWLAKQFFFSGLVKLEDFKIACASEEGCFSALSNDTIYQFTDWHPLPFLPPELAGTLAMIGELAAPVALVFGLFTRFAALALFAMAAVIQFYVTSLPPDEFGIFNPADFDNVAHYYWMMAALLIIIRGAGPLSLDHLLYREITRNRAETP